MKINEIVRNKVPNVVVNADLDSVQKTLNAYANKIVRDKIRKDRIAKAWNSAKRIALRKYKLYNKFSTKGNLKVR